MPFDAKSMQPLRLVPVFSTEIIFITVLSKVLANTAYTSSGIILGKTVYHKLVPVQAYLGIPFAEKPIDKLRYLKPVPVKPWVKPLDARSLPPGCPQFSNNPFPWLDNLPGLSPDCLYLNIWVPPTCILCRKKSVMFYLHIGGFGMSSSRLDFYDGRTLAAEGDVIVVTTNYRLGVEGFLNSHSEDAPGNMGVFDMIESLKWVRRNIEYFGGDKDSITLFGTSAGGIVIGMFTVSPLTRGLFKRAIMQSGTPANLDGEDQNSDFKTSQRIAEDVGCAGDKVTLESNPNSVVECLRGKDPFDLAKQLSGIQSTGLRPFYPTYGNEFLPENPRVSIIKGDFEPVDLMIGANDGDGSLTVTRTMKEVFGFFGEKDPKINKTFGEDILRQQFRNYPDPDSVVEHYLINIGENDFDGVRYQVITAVGDYSRICHSIYFAESFAKKTSNVYFYFYTNEASDTPWASWMLAVHHDETPFVFGYPLRYPRRYSMSDQILSRRMILAWSSFAKTGHPQGFEWPQYSKESPKYQTLNSKTEIPGYGPHMKNCEFFRSTFGF